MTGTTGTLVQTAAWSPARAYALEAKYELLKVLRMPGYAIPSIAFPAMFYLLFGVMFGRGTVGGMSMATYLIATYGAFGVIGVVPLRVRRRRRDRARAGLDDAQAREPDAADGVLRRQARHVRDLRRGRLRRARRCWA